MTVPSQDNAYKFVAIAGQIGSGKTTLAKELCSCLDTNLLSFGSFIRAEAKLRALPSDRSTLQSLGERLINELGPYDFVRKAVHTQITSAYELTVVEGVRHVEIWKVLKSLASNAILIYLDIPRETRLDRLQSRTNVSTEVAKEEMNHPMENGIPKLVNYADIILTDCSLEGMISRILLVLAESGL